MVPWPGSDCLAALLSAGRRHERTWLGNFAFKACGWKFTSVLNGFDRLVFRGALRALGNCGVCGFLDRAEVRLLDFVEFVLGATERVKEALLEEAEKADRPIVYLDSPRTDKEQCAKRLPAEHPMAEPGLICALTAVAHSEAQTQHEKGPALSQERRPLRNDRTLRYFVAAASSFLSGTTAYLSNG